MFYDLINLTTLSWLLLVLIALIVGYFFGVKNKTRLDKGDINQRYLQGFNFLLNDQSDKALEVFIKALEVDSNTVELHLALGGLFRRQGQVSRATRIHQNIIARPDLSEMHRFQAVHELAKDYVMAGLHDRAENLFLELIENHVYLDESYQALMEIYESQQEWDKALEIANKSKASVIVAKRASHYYYELAERACLENRFDKARQFIQKARDAFPESSRYALLSVKLAIKTGDIDKALVTYSDLVQSSMNVRSLMQLTLVETMLKYDHEGLDDFLVNELEVRPGARVLQVYLEQNQYSEQACEKVTTSVLHAGRADLNSWLAAQLPKFPENISLLVHQRFGAQVLDVDIYELELIKYQCSECGFKSKVLNWCCPNCNVWESQEVIST